MSKYAANIFTLSFSRCKGMEYIFNLQILYELFYGKSNIFFDRTTRNSLQAAF